MNSYYEVRGEGVGTPVGAARIALRTGCRLAGSWSVYLEQFPRPAAHAAAPCRVGSLLLEPGPAR
jgi:hypothetical protein